MTEETAGTPRTDEMEFGTEVLDSETVVRVVASEFARQLEREVAALTAEREVEQPYRTYLYWKDRAEAAEAELDAAKRALISSLNLFDEILCDPMSDIRKSFADRALVLINLPSAEAALAAKSTEQSVSVCSAHRTPVVGCPRCHVSVDQQGGL